MALALGQGRHEVRLPLGEHDDVANVKTREHEPRQECACVELHHRHARNGAVNENATCAASTARMIAAAARYGGVRANCLARAEALWWLLGSASGLRRS